MTGFPPSVRARLPNGQAGAATWLVVAAMMLFVQQLAAREFGTSGEDALLRRGIFFVSAVCLVAMALHFRRFAGAWLVALGIALNLAPILAHGGLMPVAYDTVAASGLVADLDQGDIGRQVTGSKDIILDEDDIRFPLLADRFIVSIPGYGPNIYSLGDFVLFAGVALAVGEALAMMSVPAVARRQGPLPA